MSKLYELKELGWSEQDIVQLLEELKRELGNTSKVTNVDNIQKTKNLEKRITKLLMDMGCPCNLSGMIYIREAVVYCFDKPGKARMVKEVYPTIAKKCETTETCVERAIRHTVDKIFENKNSLVEEIFGSIINPRKSKPTNGQFIHLVREYIRNFS